MEVTARPIIQTTNEWPPVGGHSACHGVACYQVVVAEEVAAAAGRRLPSTWPRPPQPTPRIARDRRIKARQARSLAGRKYARAAQHKPSGPSLMSVSSNQTPLEASFQRQSGARRSLGSSRARVPGPTKSIARPSGDCRGHHVSLRSQSPSRQRPRAALRTPGSVGGHPLASSVAQP
jgi:hypothetical protein